MPLPPLPNPTSLVERVLGGLRALLVIVVIGSTLFACNAVQVASVLVRPFSGRLFRAINRAVADFWWGLCVTVARRLNHVRIVVSGDDVPPRENAMVVANHQAMSDILVLLAYARSKERLGDLKWFVKKALKYVPGIGWGMSFLDCLFVERTWLADKTSIERTFARLVTHRVPLWLVSFVEGTRLTPAKLQRAVEYARSVQMQPLRHLLVPRIKGFVACVAGLRSHIDAVYDVTIAYEGGVPTLWQYAQGFARVAHVHVRRYPVALLPPQDELATWLLARFRDKDELLERYYRHGAFV